MVSNNSQVIQIPQNLNIEHEKSVNESAPNRETKESPMKRFKYLNRVSKLLEKKAEDDNSDSLPQVSREEQEIDNYISTKVNKKDVAVT